MHALISQSGTGIIRDRSSNISVTTALLEISWDSGLHFPMQSTLTRKLPRTSLNTLVVGLVVNFTARGIENISMAAAETKAPRRNIPIAAKRIFFRVVVFYSQYT